ncbi:MAG TPA: tyrosine-type recombinase/integrase [Steroidobacteraceae bacterium]|nr:tyrosine-type recombinase/integrase [Steroidobacteraceae bacterium]
MSSRIWTETWLRSLLKNPPPQRRTYTEKGRKGLMLRHHPGGTLTFLVRYHRGAEQVLVTIGNYPEVTLERAHDEHAQVRRMLAQGLDPAEERARAAEEQKRAREQRATSNATTAANVVAEWAWHYARRERKRPREAVRLLRHYVADPWKDRPVRELTRRDAVLLLDRIRARAPVMANRIFSLASQAFTFAVARDLTTVNPFIGVPRPGGDEAPRSRKLTDAEIASVWKGLGAAEFKASQTVRLALKLVLVTAQRPGEVAGMRWDEIDTDAALWTIPAERSKNGREHRVPLSGLALELLSQLRPLAKGRPHVFPSAHATQKRDEPMLELALSRALRNNRKNERVLGIDWFTPHDLRRSAASGMTALGIARLFVSKVLNHSDRDVTGRVYDLNEYAAEKRTALDTWADHLRAILAGKAPKIVPLQRKRATARAIA